jgi:hypothetical protein
MDTQQHKDIDDKLLEAVSALNDTMERFATSLGMPRYQSRRRVIARHFVFGLARGFGMGVGFTLLSALLISLLTFLASKNLPVIGEFIADIVRFVRHATP